MRKIKRFKITIHQKEIARRIARAKIDAALAGISDSVSQREFIFSLASEIEPSVVFETFEKGYEKLAFTPLVNRNIFSAAVITLGDNILNKIRSFEEPGLRKAGAVAVYEFMETAYKFVQDILEKEAGSENFILLSPEFLWLPKMPGIEEAAQMAASFEGKGTAMPPEDVKEISAPLLTELEADKINVLLNSDSEITPSFTVFYLASWQEKTKASSKKKN